MDRRINPFRAFASADSYSRLPPNESDGDAKVFDDSLTDEDVRSVKKLAVAMDRFEPYPIALMPGHMLARLAEAGMVETGPSCRPAVAARGYRLTPRGWGVAEAHWGEAGADLVA